MKSSTVSGIVRKRPTMLHWLGSSSAAPPAPTAEAYPTFSPTTGRSRPVSGSMIVVRFSALSVSGFQTRTGAL